MQNPAECAFYIPARLADRLRCTRFGQLLRRTRLDELPQLWNILRGDMSLVGPRPERAYFYREFEKYIPGFSNRMMVTPGLTGWAQVNGGYDLRPEEKIVYDMEYIEHQSVLLDMQCLLKNGCSRIHPQGSQIDTTRIAAAVYCPALFCRRAGKRIYYM